MDKWAELRTAYQVARLGTVSAAADELGFHRATVNRHIDVLEDEMGARIFIRHSRGYTLTETGEELLKVARKAEALINDLAGRVNGLNGQIEGEIRLSILYPFARLIMPAIVEFRRRNPLCRVRITASETLARLEYGEAHIALRAGTKPDYPDYIVREFMRVRFNLYAHDSYVREYGIPEGPEDFAGHQFILPDQKLARTPFKDWIEQRIPLEQRSVSINDLRVGFEAIKAGLGIGFMAELDVRDDDELQMVMPGRDEWSIPVWQVTHVDLHRTEKVQALLDCINTFMETDLDTAV